MTEITYPSQSLICNNVPSLDVSTLVATGLTVNNNGWNTVINAPSTHIDFVGSGAYADLQVINAGAGQGYGVLTLKQSEGSTIDITPKTINFRDASGSIQNNMTSEATYLQTGALKPDAVLDYLGSAGTTNQILSSGSGGGTLQWVDASSEFPNLAQVLAVATAGDAGDLPISNLSSLTLADTTTILSSNSLQMGAVPLVISADASGYLAVNTTPSALVSMTIKNYLPISVGGDLFYMPLFQVTV